MAESFSWLPEVLEGKCGCRPKILSAGAIEEASHGFMAQIRRVKLDWGGSSREDLPSTVVVKHPAMSTAAEAWLAAAGDVDDPVKLEELRTSLEAMKKSQQLCHTVESSVYGLFEGGKYVAPLPMPKCYASFDLKSPHPSIIMEDINHAKTCDIVDGFSEQQIYTILDGIIDLHVFSFTNASWKIVKFQMDDSLDAGFRIMFSTFMANFTKSRPDLAPKLDKIVKHIVHNNDWFNGYIDEYESHPWAILVHGDMWSPQFLWRGDKLAAIVDWQLSHPGCIMEDYLRLTTLCMPAAERKRLNQKYLEYYYEQLCERLREHGKKPPFDFQGVKAEYKKNLPYTVAMGIFAFSMWSNSAVLKTGGEGDEKRIAEILDRVMAAVDECIEAYGW